MKKMKILFCSSEAVPFAKTGGLADVSGALPQALEKRGCQVKVALPKYRSAGQQAPKMGGDIEVFLIENDKYFDREELYGDSNGDYPDNLDRFAFFCRQIIALLKKVDFKPEIIHCNDWQTALIPAYLKTGLSKDPFYTRIKTIFTIHNLAYQGIFTKDQFPKTGLNWQFFNMHALEFHDKINLLKGGLIFSDLINTVSPTYAQEIQTEEFGCGLDGVLRERKGNLEGIINGLDYQTWSPQLDKHIFRTYGTENLQDKYINKQKLQQELNLPCGQNIPLLGIVSRLASQKGIELIISALEKMPKLNLQFVLLATGDQSFHIELERIKQKKYKNISINLLFDATLAHKIYAGCDMFLMPSYFEPCGLGQLISLKYGTIPIVRKTGGLADTIVDYNEANHTGNGFVFEEYTEDEMLKAITRAAVLYNDKKKWQELMWRAMKENFSWESSAIKYIDFYCRALNEN